MSASEMSTQEPESMSMEISVNGVTINYQLDGPAEAPVLLFSNSLATSLAMWDEQVRRLTDRFRILRYDNRGHGSTPPTPGPYSLELLAKDAVGLLDALGFDKVSFCGLSMGGMVGQWLGINAPQRVERLILSNTAAYFPNKEMWRERIEMAREFGIAAIAEASIKRWFTPGYRERPDTAAVIDNARKFIMKTTSEGYLACCVAIRDMDFRDQLDRIDVPTLVIIGEKDPATLPEYGELIASRIPGAAKAVIADAAHLSNIEQADTFTNTLVDFLARSNH
jgi:3-oxoadipate enol-lactonase